MGDFLVFDNICKRYDGVEVLRNVSFAVSRGEVFSLLGPSGCGKTTLLRILGGFERPDAGRVILDGQDITELSPNRRAVNTVFQNYALFPHLSVWDNIAFGLKVAKVDRRRIAAEVERFLALTQMGEHARKRVSKISGGQKQRVAIARALINRPMVLLLDEPLAALDLKLRQRMLVELDALHDEVGSTFLYVTHDQGEAMGISDHIAVMNEGRIEQIGTPAQIYEAPVSSFVAAFIGDTNFFDGTVAEILDQEYSRLRVEDFPDVVVFNDKKLRPGDPVHLSIRPEKFKISIEPPAPAPRRNLAAGVVEEVIYLGAHTKYWVRVDGWRLAVNVQHERYLLDERQITWGDPVWLAWGADDGYMLERYREADEALLTLASDGGEDSP